MARTVIAVNEHVGADGEVQVSFGVEEPDDVAEANRSYVLDCRQSLPPLSYVADAAQPLPADGGPVELAGGEIYQRLAHHPGIRDALTRASHTPAGQVHPIRIATNTGDAELLPWEVLFLAGGGFVALDPRWPIARVTGRPAGRSNVDRLVKGKLAIAAVLAAKDRDAGPEWDALHGAVAAGGVDCDLLVLVAQDDLRQRIAGLALPNVRTDFVPADADALLRRLAEHKPNLLHFFCHGIAEFGGQLEIATRNALQLGEAPVYLGAQQLAQISEHALLVTLNACEGALAASGAHSLAYLLVRMNGGAPAAIGMRHPLASATAHRFCRALYEEALRLLAGRLGAPGTFELDWSPVMRIPRNRLCAQGGGPLQAMAARCREWSVPVLYVRPEPLRVQVASATAAEDPDYVFAMLETLRTQRAKMRPDTPPEMLAQLDTMIAQLQAVLAADGG